ncbi:MAG: putative ATPase [Akkermansiaceae bacterium]
MIYSLHIRGYRSLENFSLKLAPLTVVQGGNGVGKSNLYKALRLFGSLAEGNFPQAIASEGGTGSCLWAGPVSGRPKRKEISLDLKAVDFRWQLAFGLIPSGPEDPTLFKGDPDVKKETISSEKDRYSRSSFAPDISNTESLVSFIRDHQGHALLSTVREQILSWRFYDDFRHDLDSPLRHPSPCAWSPVLSENGDNLAAALRTIQESGRDQELAQIIDLAFPDHLLEISGEGSHLEILWQQPFLSRPVKSRELSDGTLQFLALCAALLSPKPPSLLVLNEPENSLNPALYPALIKLIDHARQSSQVLIITHSDSLCESLVSELDASARRLAIQDGATRFIEDLGPKRVWNFEE